MLSGSGIDIQSEVDSDYIIFCPYHNNYRTPAAEVSRTRGTFFCFSCHESRSLVELIMHVSQKTYFESVRFIETYQENADISSILEKSFQDEPEYKAFDQLLIKRLNNQALESPRAMRYFESRQITANSVSELSLGYSENQDMVTIPISDPSGEVFVGFVARSIEGKDFKNTPGLPKSKILFNLHRSKYSDTVYIVESSFDAIRLHQCGLPSVATLGSNVSRKQLDLLNKYFNYAIVIPDNDDAGIDMAKKIKEKMGKKAVSIGLPSRFKDIGDMSNEDINKLVSITDDPLLSIIK